MASKAFSGSLDVTKGTIWKQLLRLFFPVFLSSFFQQAYSLINTWVIGHYATTNALGGIQATQSLVDLVVGFSIGVGTGCAIICGQQFGAGQNERLRTSVCTAMSIAVVGGLGFSALSLAFLEPALRLMGTPAELMEQSLAFSRFYMGALVFSIVFNMGSAIQRAVGDTKTPAMIVAATCVVNVLCDFVFIAGMRMEAAGAGLSTAISLLFGAAVTTIKLMHVDGPWRLDFKGQLINPHTAKVMIVTGLPLGLQSSAYSISNIIVQSTVNSFNSTSIVTAWGLSGRIDGVVWMITDSLGVSTTTFAAQNFGASDEKRVRAGLRTSFMLTLLVVGGSGLLVTVFAPQLAAFFVSDAEIEANAVHMIYYIAPFYVLFSIMDNISGTIRGCGESMTPMLITMAGTCLLRIVWLLAVVPQVRTLDSVLIVYPITYVVTTIAFVIYYRSGRWLRRGQATRARALS